ncbi:hypothetical protein L207DRAFT_633981 [Hyaloscypha variabilis F]|uniref:Uncharacterized protein n=1 Tax=Hyaloscypha variabilis (strain UAMH 11265 / GT02V1 / F) TaxID=1149755 RepID=A0A2J6RLG8_HYAVF|nr:hypothetical protein L207DRAFT_633981 [Hyaloscypha variabilis F]
MGLRNKKKEGERLVYDPFREVLSKEVISDEQTDHYQCVQVKGRSKHIEIYLDVGHGPAQTKTLLARVDIGQLGMSQWLQRYMGNLQEIWVKGRAPSTHKIRTWPVMGKSDCGLDTPEQRQYPASFHN